MCFICVMFLLTKGDDMLLYLAIIKHKKGKQHAICGFQAWVETSANPYSILVLPWIVYTAKTHGVSSTKQKKTIDHFAITVHLSLRIFNRLTTHFPRRHHLKKHYPFLFVLLKKHCPPRVHEAISGRQKKKTVSEEKHQFKHPSLRISNI